jgi:hypothetical protein
MLGFIWRRKTRCPTQWTLIQTGIAQGIVVPEPPISLAVITKIIAAAKTSIAFPPA